MAWRVFRAADSRSIRGITTPARNAPKTKWIPIASVAYAVPSTSGTTRPCCTADVERVSRASSGRSSTTTTATRIAVSITIRA